MDGHERLRWARRNAGYATAAEAARAHGWNAAAYRHHENGTTGFRPERGAEYADTYKVPPEWLVLGVGPSPLDASDGRTASATMSPHLRTVVRKVPVLGEVAAGLWRETRGLSSAEAEESLQVDVHGYEGVELFALRVVGPSMDRIYPEGRWVIVARPPDAGLRVDDVVVVRRNRQGLVETTLKQLALDGERVVLWPRSHHPDFQEPMYFSGGEGDQDAPEIIGVVVADYALRERPARAIFLGESVGGLPRTAPE